jgi:hypothetical protein
LCGGGGGSVAAAGFCLMQWRWSKITVKAGFLLAMAKDHVDIVLGDIFVDDIELDGDFDS